MIILIEMMIEASMCLDKNEVFHFPRFGDNVDQCMNFLFYYNTNILLFFYLSGSPLIVFTVFVIVTHVVNRQETDVPL